MTRSLFACESGWEEPLADELGRVLAGSNARGAARRLGCGGLGPRPVAASALPGAGAAISAGCRARCGSVNRAPGAAGSVSGSSSGWPRTHALGGCHLFANPGSQQVVPSRRTELIGLEVDQLLRKKQRRLLRTRVDDWQRPFAADEALVQLALVEPDRGYVSCCSAAEVARWRHCLSRFPAGVVSVQAAREAPSREMEKLAEAELRLDRPIATGETCVDLGSSPGSWAWHALRRGARVVAVDRSPLRADLMGHPHLSFVRGDAFQYRPEQPVDWLLCDVIAFPQRTLELLAQWLANGWCRFFCVTIKFRGRGRLPAVGTVQSGTLSPRRALLPAAIFQQQERGHGRGEDKNDAVPRNEC